MAMCRRLVLGLVIFMVVEQPSWLNSPHGNWKVQGQRVAGNCKSVMFPFGPAVGDTTYPSGFDVGGDINAWVGPIVLPSDIMLIGEGPYNNAFINAQGVISFEVPHPSLVTTGPVAGTSTAMIMVNPMDLVSTSIADGNIFYRLVGDAAGLADIQQAMDDTWDPTPIEWALIVTWSCVRRNGGPDDQRQTFQFVLTAAGPIVPTFHNFAEVHTDTDMIIGVQAEGVFLGGAVPSAVLLENYNTCPCGRWAAQVETSFIAPASTACSANTCAASTPPADCQECTADYMCRCEVTNSGLSDRKLLDVTSFSKPPSVISVTPDIVPYTFTNVETELKYDPCKFSVKPTINVDASGVAYIAILEIRFGRHPSTDNKLHKLLKVKSGTDLFLHPQRVKASPPFTYDNGDVTVIVTYEDANAISVYSPTCRWSVVFYAREVDQSERSIVVSTDVRAMMEDTVCGLCDPVARSGTLAPPSLYQCQCSLSDLPHFVTFTGDAGVLDYQASDDSKKIDVVIGRDKFDSCKFKVTVTLRSDGDGVAYLGIVDVRFGPDSSSPNKYDKLIKMKDGRHFFLHPERTPIYPPFEYSTDDVTVTLTDNGDSGATYAEQNSYRLTNAACGWSLVYFAKDIPDTDRKLTIEMQPQTTAGPCGVCE